MKKILLLIIKIYKKVVSPIVCACGINCKYYPTCSDYMVQAIQKYGCFKGTFIGIKRLFRCNPFSKGGYDPLK